MSQTQSPEPIIITPQQVTQGAKVYSIQQEIIQTLLNYDNVDVVGVSNAIFLACSGVRLSSAVSRANVSRAFVDYLDIPITGKFESIFFTVTRKQVSDLSDKIASFEKGMDLTPNGQLITASREVSVGTLTAIALSKLQSYSKLKIIGAGTATNKAVYIGLQICRGEISKELVSVETIRLGAIPTIRDREKLVTSIELFLQKGRETIYDERHAEIMSKVKDKIARIR